MGRYVVFGDEGPDTTGLMSGGTPKYIKFRTFFSYIVLVLTFKMLKEDQALKPRVDTL